MEYDPEEGIEQEEEDEPYDPEKMYEEQEVIATFMKFKLQQLPP